MQTNIIGIHTLSVSTEMMQFAKSGIYRTVPIVIYKINDEQVKYFYINRPIEIFRENMDYRNLENVVGGYDKDISFLTIPGRAYNKMQHFANKNVNKVIADMITHVVVDIVKEIKDKDSDAHNVFFIDTVDSNKIIGRLGYLYLENSFNTIAFMTYKAGGLLTDVLNGGKSKLEFDINYFAKEGYEDKMWSEIIPNDFMESLTQTVFFNIPISEAQLSPLRCDILSQGLSKNEIQKKVKIIYDILKCPQNMTLPFSEKGGKNSNSTWVRIPRILNDCIEASEIYKNIAQTVLEEEIYEEYR